MDKMKVVKPKVEQLNRCEAMTGYLVAGTGPDYKYHRCAFKASIEFQGKNYCRRHAGEVAIVYLSGEASQ